MSGPLGALTAVVFAKEPVPGRVKTRLVRPGGLDAEAAAEVAEAMLDCTVRRLRGWGRVIVAVSPDGAGPRLAGRPGVTSLAGVPMVDQGGGSLGARLERVWRGVARLTSGPVAFFGVDSPDVPADAVAAIEPALAAHDAAVGPTHDGGYWTLAAASPQPALLSEIDWGTGAVYDQTVQRAGAAGLTVCSLPAWYDVDAPADVAALRERLAGASADDEALRTLAGRLDRTCSRT